MEIRTIAQINEVDLLIIENGEKRVPIKPICELLGVDFSSQLKKIKDDEILSSTLVLNTILGKDKKSRDMQTIPYKYVFGWLFGINPKNVKPEAKAIVIKYKLLCYDALYYHFTAHSEFLEEKQLKLEEKMSTITNLKSEFSTAKNKLKDAEDELKSIRNLKFEDWDLEKRQLKLDL